MRLRRQRYDYQRAGDSTEGYGPQFAFAAATLTGFTIWTGSIATLPHGFAAPIVATAFLALAVLFGLVAWHRRNDDPNNVTYTDVAGALTLIGLCAAATIEPDQLVHLVQAKQGEH